MLHVNTANHHPQRSFQRVMTLTAMYTIHKVQPHSDKFSSNKDVSVTGFEDSEAKTIARERCQACLWI